MLEALAAWLILPLLVAATSLGFGLLVQRATRVRLDDGMALPVGFAAALALGAVPYALGLGAGPSALVLVLVAAVGIGLARRRALSALPHPLAALAALAAYVLYLAPVALSGAPSFTGYTLLGDTSVHFALVDYVSAHGSRSAHVPPSTYATVTTGLLTGGYPLALHFELASLRWLLRVDVAWLYQPFMATMMGLAALPAWALARREGLDRLPAAAAALVVTAAYLPYSYALQGGLKEVGMILLVLLGAALAVRLIDGEPALGLALVLGIVVAAAFGIYSAGGLPWFALIVGGAGLIALVRRQLSPGRALVAAAACAAVFVLAAAPGLLRALAFFRQGDRLLRSDATTGADLGNLVGPIAPWEALGVWFGADFRFAPVRPDVTYALAGLVAVLALLGVARSVRDRRYGAFLALAAALVVWLALPAGPYIEAKLLAILSPTVVLAAMVGTLVVARARARLEALVLALVVAGGVLTSDALAYHSAYLAPRDRHDELAEVGRRFAGTGPAFLNEFEEYGKHYLRALAPLSPYEGWTNRPDALTDPGPVYAQFRDLDEFRLDFIQSYPLVIQRRSPVASRPPVGYRLAYLGRYYEVWRRTGPAASEHVALNATNDPTSRAPCRAVRRLARRAARDGGALVAAERPPATVAAARTLPHPPVWQVAPDQSLFPTGPGRISGRFTLRPGRYRVWVQGTFGRGASVTFDRRAVGRVDEIQTPGGWALGGEVTADGLAPHLVELERGGGDLSPGNGRPEGYGLIAVEPVAPTRLRTVAPDRAESLCGRRLDWVDAVAGRP